MKHPARKKVLAMLLCLILLCTLLTGCRSRAASQAEKLIEQLDVSAPDSEAVARAREAYDALTPEERETLENAGKLTDAETRLWANEADALIGAIGEVTLESGPAIDAARAAYDALGSGSRALTTGLPKLEKAEKTYHRLMVEAAAAGIDALIDAIGEVTLESGPAIEAARKALENAEEEVLALVREPEKVESAEADLHRLEVKAAAAEFDAAVEALGEITVESRNAVEAARKAYDALDGEIQAEVRTFNTLQKAEETLVYLDNAAKAAALDAEIAALGEVTLESESAVRALRRQYDALPENVRELVTAAGTLTKAEKTIQGIRDRDAADEIKKFIDAKQYDEAIGYAEKYMKGRELSDIQGNVVKYCLDAYAAKANALIKNSHYQEAYDLLTKCKKTYAGADLTAVNKALTALNKAVAEPANGKIFSSSARGGNNKLTIKIGDKPMYIKFINTSNTKSTLTIYLRANGSATVYLKNGTYKVKYATGDKWFGTKDLFGSSTRCGVCNDTIKFSTPSGYIWTGTLTLKAVANGNLTTSNIPKSNFDDDDA